MGVSKVLDLSANALPFLVIQVIYLISVSWSARVSQTYGSQDVFFFLV